MLARMSPEELDRYVDWAYHLALDLTCSGYPTYADGIKTREGFIRAAREGMERNNEELLLVRVDGEVCGWIQWSWQAEERYAETYSFLTASHTDEALSAFIAHATERCKGYALHMGFPAGNEKAASWLEGHGFRRLEESVHHTLFFNEYAAGEPPSGVARMEGDEDRAAFLALHTETDMYWTAERMLADIDNWRVYLYREGGNPLAALFARVPPGGWPEIFGVAGERTPDTSRALLTACLNDCKAAGCPHMTCFEDDEAKLPILAELGFRVVSRYICYQKIL